ncbi:MAG: N-6 DNA methylase [Promethearchaeota archaeon]
MISNPKHSQNIKFDFIIIKHEVTELEKILFEDKIYEVAEFKKWQNDFKIIYGSKNTNIQLYITIALIFFIGHSFVSKYVLKTAELVYNNKHFISSVKNLQYKVKTKFKNIDLFDFEYFNPIFSLLESNKISFLPSLINALADYLFKLDIEPVYKFDFLIQKIISPIIRHESGEFYTMPFLVEKMIDNSYNFGERILDPCCGSGNFLIEIIKRILSSNKTEQQKILAINNIYGFDINPISIFITKINFLILLKEFSPKVKICLFVVDSLFPQQFIPNNKVLIQNFLNSFDLIIGNPHWYTFREISSIKYQNQIKMLAEKLDIKPLPKNILNIEISALFFYQAKEVYLKNNGKVFLVITKGVITGSHASRFRNFRGFKNVKIWSFEPRLEKLFNIDFICLFAQKSENKSKLYNKEIKHFYVKIKSEANQIDYFSKLVLEIAEEDNLLPYFIEKRGKRTYTKKFISQKLTKDLLPYGESIYKKLFHKGADLNPRNLIFVNYEEIKNKLIKIDPDTRIFKRAKAPWNIKEFSNEIIEKKYIFNVIKSTELIKFHVINYYNVFLPLSKNDLSFKYNKLTDNAKKFYDKINQIYLKNKKDTTKHASLMDNLNRWSKLINPRQQSKIKCVYNNSGSMINSAVVIGDFLITSDLSFYDTNNLDEAYYLSSILNSILISKQVKIKKSSRHIFKIPFEVPIKKFDANNQNHKLLAEISKECHNIAEKTTIELMGKDPHNLSKIKLQKILNKRLNSHFKQIDEILKFDLN